MPSVEIISNSDEPQGQEAQKHRNQSGFETDALLFHGRVIDLRVLRAWCTVRTSAQRTGADQ